MKTKLILGLLLISFSLLLAEDLRLDILFTSDMHGGIDRADATFMNPEFPPKLGGGASAATYIREIRSLSNSTNRASLIVDGGDFFQGHPIGTITKGTAVVEYMNLMGYDISVIGNHEFDIGETELINTLKSVKYPVLSCNLVKKGTTEPVDYVKPYLIIEKLGVKIGVIGLTTTDTKKMSFPEFIKNVDFLDEKQALEKWIPIVKAKGADIIMVVSHSGLPYEPEPEYKNRYGSNKPAKPRYWGWDSQELAHEVKGIDLFFGGHMHKGFNTPWTDPVTHTLVMQGYAYGTGIGHITIKIDKDTKTVSGYEMPTRDNMLVTLFEEQFLPAADIDSVITARQIVAEKGMDEVVGEAGNYLSKQTVDAQSCIGNFTCDAMREDVNADFSFLNLGGVRGEIKMGYVTYRDIFNVMPFDNQVVTITVDGNMLKKIIEQRIWGDRHGMFVSGVKVVYSRKRENGDRVTLLEVGGKSWDPNKTYTIATTDFLLQGNAGLTILTTIPETQVKHNEINLRDSMTNYFKRHKMVRTKIDDRWLRDDGAGLTPAMAKALKEVKK